MRSECAQQVRERASEYTSTASFTAAHIFPCETALLLLLRKRSSPSDGESRGRSTGIYAALFSDWRFWTSKRNKKTIYKHSIQIGQSNLLQLRIIVGGKNVLSIHNFFFLYEEWNACFTLCAEVNIVRLSDWFSGEWHLNRLAIHSV